ncbi:MAG: hypothetical protein AUJ52_10765 [Elusimicrobia bacterium CG1_02_63_36]|nr:MAG: hypothetical protein AUJ52_10765 [Elusimicrobia bacterium CG1_02_63_36]
MNGARWAAAALIACVAAAAALEVRSETAARLRDGKPLTGLLSIRHEGQEGVTPPALYMAAAGPRGGSLDLVRIPPDFPVFERGPGGEAINLRTLADVYGQAYGPDRRLDRADETIEEAALTMLQSDPAWPEERGGPFRDSDRPAALDFHLRLSVGAGARPGFPREMRRLLADRLEDPLFWPRFAADAPALRARERAGRGAYELLLLARDFRRLSPARLRLSELTDPALSHRLLARVFARAAGAPEPEGPVDAEVLNGTDSDGLALKATRLLRLRGFDVVHFGSTRPLEHTTRFLDRAGNADGAAAIAHSLGCAAPEVVTALEARPRAAVTVVLGQDFASCRALAETAERP